MTRWFIHHLPDLACAMVACYSGFPVPIGGRTSLAGRSRWSTVTGLHDQPPRVLRDTALSFLGDSPVTEGGSFQKSLSGSPSFLWRS
jgi:hypothetical protein